MPGCRPGSRQLSAGRSDGSALTLTSHRLAHLTSAALSLVLATGSGRAADRPPPHLHQRWLEAEVACGGGAVSQAAMRAGCERRDAVSRALAAAGWCYGPRERAGAQRRWHHCG